MDNAKIKAMRAGGKILGEVLEEVMNSIRPGMSELDIDVLAEKLILKKGGKPGFKRVPGYKHTICISINDTVVHGIPSDRLIEEGDIVGVDCGVYYEGFHTDMAESIIAGNSKDKKNGKVENFLAVGKKAMFNAIKQAKAGAHVGLISKAMQQTIEGGGYSVVRNLVGHGVGKELHEAPEIPGVLSGKIEKTPKLSSGQTIAIEAIYNMGDKSVVYRGDDDWTIVTEDGSLSGLFERTILVTEDGPELITRFSTDKI